MRASDILAQRLPSVPEKPATDANASKSPNSAAVPKPGTGNSAVKPKSSPVVPGAQATKAPGVTVQALPAAKKAVAAGGSSATQDSAPNTATVTKPVAVTKPIAQEPSITEQSKPPAPAAAPAIQPASPPDGSPH